MTRIKWEPAAVVPRGVVAVLLDPPTGDVVMHWGDGTSRPLAGAALHTYPEPNVYTAMAKIGDTVIASATIPVKDGLAPEVAHSHNPEWSKEQYWWIDVTGPDLPGEVVGPVRVDWPKNAWWPDDYLTETAYARHGHRFERPLKPGTWPVQVTDTATRRTRIDEIVVPETIYDPDFVVRYLTPEEDPDGWTVEIELTAVQANRPVRLCFEWGACNDDSYDSVVIEKPEVGTTVRHKYLWADEYGLGDAMIKYVTDDAGHGQRQTFELPRPKPAH